MAPEPGVPMYQGKLIRVVALLRRVHRINEAQHFPIYLLGVAVADAEVDQQFREPQTVKSRVQK
jgi:hypothetical protein